MKRKLFVNSMGGYIVLKSKVGKGSTFRILLPITKAICKIMDNKLVPDSDNTK